MAIRPLHVAASGGGVAGVLVTQFAQRLWEASSRGLGPADCFCEATSEALADGSVWELRTELAARAPLSLVVCGAAAVGGFLGHFLARAVGERRPAVRPQVGSRGPSNHCF